MHWSSKRSEMNLKSLRFRITDYTDSWMSLKSWWLNRIRVIRAIRFIRGSKAGILTVFKREKCDIIRLVCLVDEFQYINDYAAK